MSTWKKDIWGYSIPVIFSLSLTANLPILLNLFFCGLKQKLLFTSSLVTQRSRSCEAQLLPAWRELAFINIAQNLFMFADVADLLPLAIMCFLWNAPSVENLFSFRGIWKKKKGRWSQLLVTYGQLESNVWKMGFWISRDFTKGLVELHTDRYSTKMPGNNATSITANKKTALLNSGLGRLMMMHSFLVSKINMITCILKLIQTHC